MLNSIEKPCVYILQSLKNSRYYIGSTDNLKRRLLEHQRGKSKATCNLLPIKLVFSQGCTDLKDARRLEHRIKKLKSRDIIEKIIKDKVIKLT